MDFDLNQVSVNAPSLFDLSKQNSSGDDRKTNSIVGSVFEDNAEKLHSDLIGIEEEITTDERNDKHILFNPTEPFASSYAKQQQTQQHIIPTYKDLTTSSNIATHTKNIGLPAAMYATTKDNNFFDENNDNMVLSNISKSNQLNEKQVRILETIMF